MCVEPYTGNDKEALSPNDMGSAIHALLGLTQAAGINAATLTKAASVPLQHHLSLAAYI